MRPDAFRAGLTLSAAPSGRALFALQTSTEVLALTGHDPCRLPRSACLICSWLGIKGRRPPPSASPLVMRMVSLPGTATRPRGRKRPWRKRQPCNAPCQSPWSCASGDDDGGGLEGLSGVAEPLKPKSGQPASSHAVRTAPPSVHRSVPRWMASCCSCR